MATVYLWKASKDGVGHISVRLDDKTYISWWPVSRLRALFGCKPKFHTYGEDESAEKRKPDESLYISEELINVEAVKNWWLLVQFYSHYRLLGMNCARTVYMALEVGMQNFSESAYISLFETITKTREVNMHIKMNRIVDWSSMPNSSPYVRDIPLTPALVFGWIKKLIEGGLTELQESKKFIWEVAACPICREDEDSFFEFLEVFARAKMYAKCVMETRSTEWIINSAHDITVDIEDFVCRELKFLENPYETSSLQSWLNAHKNHRGGSPTKSCKPQNLEEVLKLIESIQVDVFLIKLKKFGDMIEEKLIE